MDSCSSFVEISWMLDLVELYTRAQAWLANSWRPIAEIEFWLAGAALEA